MKGLKREVHENVNFILKNFSEAVKKKNEIWERREIRERRDIRERRENS